MCTKYLLTTCLSLPKKKCGKVTWPYPMIIAVEWNIKQQNKQINQQESRWSERKIEAGSSCMIHPFVYNCFTFDGTSCNSCPTTTSLTLNLCWGSSSIISCSTCSIWSSKICCSSGSSKVITSLWWGAAVFNNRI